MMDDWNTLHAIERFRPKYPSEEVVRFMAMNYPDNQDKFKVLDLGCGLGRHIFFLIKEGYKTYGCDFAANGLDYINNELEKNEIGVNDIVKHSDMENLLYPDKSFNVVIAYSVLHYNDMTGYKNALSEIHRVLKTHGKAFIFTRTVGDYRYGMGRQIEPNTFIMENSLTNEEGMTITFLDHAAINEMFYQFKIKNIERTEISFDYMQHKNSNWAITIEKVNGR